MLGNHRRDAGVSRIDMEPETFALTDRGNRANRIDARRRGRADRGNDGDRLGPAARVGVDRVGERVRTHPELFIGFDAPK